VARESKKKMGKDEAEKFMHNRCKGMIFRFIVINLYKLIILGSGHSLHYL